MADEKDVKVEKKPKKKVKKQNRIVKFCKDLISEIKKVVWPSRKQVLNNTGVVLLVCVISGAALFAVDSIFGLLLQLVTG
ncbi:MAG: preprotein translocase subunit SecE [Oscillospiraceae bacterium]|nr:preprotein translocase subunit SecE [Ruminococcus sp.]MCD8345430.1 preprotein translocase subunit SecE [Oscillospiraceae bacterium]